MLAELRRVCETREDDRVENPLHNLVSGESSSHDQGNVEGAVMSDDSRSLGEDAAEVAQVYVADVQSSLPRPVKELKGFRKVFLKAGEKKTVSISLNQNSFAFYDPQKQSWVAEKGDFKILVGSSSRDIRLSQDFRLTKTFVEK